MEINDSPVNVNVKYEKEVRFTLGFALVQLDNGEVEGRRIPCFEYTEQTILAHKDWIRKYDGAIRHIKDLPTTERKDWVSDPRNGRIFENDADLTLLSGLGIRCKRRSRPKVSLPLEDYD